MGTSRKLSLSWQFLETYGSGWRNDVMNQCLEFEEFSALEMYLLLFWEAVETFRVMHVIPAFVTGMGGGGGGGGGGGVNANTVNQMWKVELQNRIYKSQ